MIKQSLLAGMVAAMTVLPTAAQAVEAPPGWKLVWQDEFDDEAIDASSWGFDLGAGGWGNGEAQFYTDRPENARIEGGMLVIEARREKYRGSYYSSARMKTQGLRAFKFGRFEARIKVPAGKGLWPAFWLLGSDIADRGWPACGEVDIMEYLGKEPDLVLGTLHGPGYSGALGPTKRHRLAAEVAGDFHVFAVEWGADRLAWYCDGTEYFSLGREELGAREWVFDKPFFIVLNLAVGGSLPGPVALDTPFPARLLVDYVRVYERSD